MISQHVQELSEMEAFAAFTVIIRKNDNPDAPIVGDLWRVKKYKRQQLALGPMQFSPNVGSVSESTKLHPEVRENRVAELAAFYHNEENIKEEKSFFE